MGALTSRGRLFLPSRAGDHLRASLNVKVERLPTGSEHLEELYELAFTGKGTSLITEATLIALMDRAAEKGAAVDALDVYRVDGDRYQPCVGYFVNGVELEEETAGMPSGEAIAYVRGEILKVLAAAKAEGGEYVYDLWLVQL